MVDRSRSCRACANNQTNQNNRPNMPQSNSLMRKLQAIDFAITETVLYLDAYPESRTALAYYKKLIEERDRILAQMEGRGTPLTHRSNTDPSRWTWTNGPWPWQIDAN